MAAAVLTPCLCHAFARTAVLLWRRVLLPAASALATGFESHIDLIHPECGQLREKRYPAVIVRGIFIALSARVVGRAAELVRLLLAWCRKRA